MNIRILLLRLLIASWMIPFSWAFVFPLFALLGGVEIASGEVKKFNRALWNGV